MNKKQLIEEMRNALKGALNRGDRHVSNIIINETAQVYASLGIRNIHDMIESLNNVKPAKSKETLYYNIKNGLLKGTRGDGQEVNTDLFTWD